MLQQVAVRHHGLAIVSLSLVFFLCSLITPTGGFIDLYIVQYKNHVDDWGNSNATTTFGVSSNSLSHLLRDLAPLTVYDVRVWTQNDNGISDFSNEAMFSTFGEQFVMCLFITLSVA